MKTVVYNNHKTEIKMVDKEKIFCDGKEVSSKWSATGATRVFRVVEDGGDIQYEVVIGTCWHVLTYWCEVRRKGEIIYTDR
jgi:hypothetical protein